MAVFQRILAVSLISLFFRIPAAHCQKCGKGQLCGSNPCSSPLETGTVKFGQEWEDLDKAAVPLKAGCNEPYECRANIHGEHVCKANPRVPGPCDDNTACSTNDCTLPDAEVMYKKEDLKETRHGECKKNKCVFDSTTNQLVCKSGEDPGEHTTAAASTTMAGGGGGESSAVPLPFSKALGYYATVGVIALIY